MHLLDGEGVYAAGGMASGAVGFEAAGGHGVEERLSDDAARGVASAEDEDVVGPFHECILGDSGFSLSSRRGRSRNGQAWWRG